MSTRRSERSHVRDGGGREAREYVERKRAAEGVDLVGGELESKKPSSTRHARQLVISQKDITSAGDLKARRQTPCLKPDEQNSSAYDGDH